jgi:uncharacterized protein YcnI
MRRLVAVVVAALLVLAGAPASAHVLLFQAAPNGDGTSRLYFSFDHSCRTAPTTGLQVELPDGMTGLDTEQPRGWTGEVAGATVTWSGPGVRPGLDPDETTTFTVDVEIVGEVGETFVLPAVQTCANGRRLLWQDTAVDAAHPAPVLEATPQLLARGGPVERATAVSRAEVLAWVAGFALLALLLGGWLGRRSLGSRP